MRYFIGAKIYMKPENQGGRHSYFTAGWCPHLHLGSIQYIAVRVAAVMETNQSGVCFPGEEGEVVFLFFPTATVMGESPSGFDELSEGSLFEIAEGNRVVGTGRVLLKWSESE